MSSNSHLSHLPLQAVRQSLTSIATGLRAGGRDGGALDLLELHPTTVCTNALALARESSPVLERVLLTLGPFAVLIYGIHHYVYRGMAVPVVIGHITSHFQGSITIPSSHKLHKSLLSWLSARGKGSDPKRLTLHGTGHVKSQTDIYGFDDEAQTDLSYVPAAGSSSLWFDGHKLTLRRSDPKEVQLYHPNGMKLEGLTKSRESDIVISCYNFSGSADPIKKFLEHVRQSTQPKQAMTTFFRVGKQLDRGETWGADVKKPSRSLDSIAMEDEKKSALVQDIGNYLAPESEKWYGARGLPWRRGLLFYGPPGSGKTSTCAAIAGHFGLSVFIISLSNESLNDDILEELFDELPPRCLVLLEDVDSAGIGRTSMKKPRKKGEPKQGVTLSGLLNSIDGPCSSEGRLLVLTSNSPDSLDPALVRPGRIDRKILLGNASAEVTEKLFSHIFSELLTPADLSHLSKQFATLIPEGKLAPAEIQNFLLEHRKNAASAIVKASAWAADLIATKDSGKNVDAFAGEIGSSAKTSDSKTANCDTSETDTTESTFNDSGIESPSDTDADCDPDAGSQCDGSDSDDSDNEQSDADS